VIGGPTVTVIVPGRASQVSAGRISRVPWTVTGITGHPSQWRSTTQYNEDFSPVTDEVVTEMLEAGAAAPDANTGGGRPSVVMIRLEEACHDHANVLSTSCPAPSRSRMRRSGRG